MASVPIVNDSMYQGDAAEVTIPVTDNAGEAVDLTGAWIEYVVKVNSWASDDVITKTTDNGGITITDPGSGQAILKFVEDDTLTQQPRPYWHRARMKDAQQDPLVIFEGQLTIKPLG